MFWRSTLWSEVRGWSVGYDGFVSYSHAADGLLAPRLQQAMARFAKPWWRRRALSIFRDETGLSANPHLWSSIVTALDESRFFILLASPDSAASEWVGREIEHWVEHHGGEQILVVVVVTDGDWVWDAAVGDIDLAASTAAHPRLQGVFASEPRHVDLIWARTERQVDHRDGRFRDAVADLAAPLHGKGPRDLVETCRGHSRRLVADL